MFVRIARNCEKSCIAKNIDVLKQLKRYHWDYKKPSAIIRLCYNKATAKRENTYTRLTTPGFCAQSLFMYFFWITQYYCSIRAVAKVSRVHSHRTRLFPILHTTQNINFQVFKIQKLHKCHDLKILKRKIEEKITLSSSQLPKAAALMTTVTDQVCKQSEGEDPNLTRTTANIW